MSEFSAFFVFFMIGYICRTIGLPDILMVVSVVFAGIHLWNCIEPLFYKFLGIKKEV